jgi:hypothetical protein
MEVAHSSETLEPTNLTTYLRIPETTFIYIIALIICGLKRLLVERKRGIIITIYTSALSGNVTFSNRNKSCATLPRENVIHL